MAAEKRKRTSEKGPDHIWFIGEVVEADGRELLEEMAGAGRDSGEGSTNMAAGSLTEAKQ